MNQGTDHIINSLEYGQSSVKDLEVWLLKWLCTLEEEVESLQKTILKSRNHHQRQFTSQELLNHLTTLNSNISFISRETKLSTQRLHQHLNDLKLPIRIQMLCNKKL